VPLSVGSLAQAANAFADRAFLSVLVLYVFAGALLSVLVVLVFYIPLIPFTGSVIGRMAPASSERFSSFATAFFLTIGIRDTFEALQRVFTGALRAVGRTGAILIAHVVYPKFGS